MTERKVSWPRRHPGLILLAVNAVLFAGFALLAEVFLRLYVPYNPGYYMAVKGTSREVEYPYGTIKINRDGFADIDFDLSRTRQVGYFGDSVTYGVGAGYGYRFSDLLREAYPDVDHLNLGGIGLSVSQDTIDRSLELADRYGLDTAVYFMNLNDIVPDATVAPQQENAAVEEAPWTRRTLLWLSGHADWLRGKSYLYTALRTFAKNQLEARGVGFHGYEAFELEPDANRAVVLETAARVVEFHDRLAEHGAELIVVLLPYEMQISDEATRVYQSHGIHWEPGFLEGSTQRILRDALAPHLRVIDLMPAFVDPERPAESQAENGVGEYYVYNRGDKLDWNHPNREGHRRIAEYLERVGLLGPPGPHGSSPIVAKTAGAE
ncbi:MAG: SGNH/GDSL hydrolase family protein [Deltaproteobacteria bacterium]|nr:SGNH/GDSL hydrolase family protein [Deltaproteobacteria bacterium]